MAELLLIISNSSGLSFEYLNGAMQFTTKNPTVGSTDTVFCWCCDKAINKKNLQRHYERYHAGTKVEWKLEQPKSTPKISTLFKNIVSEV